MRIHSSYRSYAKRFDLYLIIATLALVVIGMLAVYSATEFPESPRAGFFARHLFAIPVALVALLLAMALPLRALEDLSYLLYVGSILLLLAVLLVGVEAYGAKRWLVAGPLRIQPSELAKVTTGLALARYLVGKRRDPKRVGTLLVSLGLCALPVLLILKQPDLGTSGAFIGLGMGVLIWAGLPFLHLFLMISPAIGLLVRPHWLIWGLFLTGSFLVLWRRKLSWLLLAVYLVGHVSLYVAAPKVWDRLEPYQQARLTSFLHPEKDPGGAGYQVIQSKITIGSGSIWGKGYLHGSQKALAFLPQQHTDFIFGVIGEEFGFLGSFLTILFFILLIIRGYYLALHCRNPFAGTLAVGLATLLLYHAGVNLAMTVGLLPVTGLPLPLLSYGGSFLVSVFLMLGLLFNISAHRYDY